MPAAVNDPAAAPTVRRPLLRALWNGAVVPGGIEASWTSHNRYASDDWRASFATSADPQFGPAWWDSRASAPPLELDLQVGMLAAAPSPSAGAVNWVSLGVGYVDKVALDLDHGTVALSGRDLSALLIDAPTAELFQNQTASAIVTTIAGRHGLTADVTSTAAVPYPGPVLSGASDNRRDRDSYSGRFWKVDHTRGTLGHASRATKEWELLVELAREQGFDLYVTGRTLSFHPPADPGASPYLLRYSPRTGGSASPASNAIGLQLHREVMQAKPIEVRVETFHSRIGKAFTGVALSPGAVAGAKANQVHKFIRPNLTQQQADTLAANYLTDISRHERVIRWSEPANMLLTPRSIVRLEGTGTGFDQIYYADEVTRTISFERGFRMEPSAKNHSPQVQT